MTHWSAPLALLRVRWDGLTQQRQQSPRFSLIEPRAGLAGRPEKYEYPRHNSGFISVSMDGHRIGLKLIRQIAELVDPRRSSEGG
jgi:hypothetical protein